MLFKSQKNVKPGCVSVGIFGVCVSYGKNW